MFCCAWESPCEAYHQYLVEHPEAVLAHHQPHCPNASGVRICTGSGGLAVDHGDLTVTLAEELDLTCGFHNFSSWGPGVRIPVDYQCVSRGFKHPADLSSFFLSVLVIDKYLVCRLCSGFSRLKMHSKLEKHIQKANKSVHPRSDAMWSRS